MLNAYANNLLQRKEQAKRYATLIMEELDPENLYRAVAVRNVVTRKG